MRGRILPCGAVIQPLMQLRSPSRHITAVLDAAAASSAASSRSPLPSMISLPKQASAHVLGGGFDGGDLLDGDDDVNGDRRRRRRLASVSAFAFQGTNAHAMLEAVAGGGGGGGCSFVSSSARRLLDERRHWQDYF